MRTFPCTKLLSVGLVSKARNCQTTPYSLLLLAEKTAAATKPKTGVRAKASPAAVKADAKATATAQQAKETGPGPTTAQPVKKAAGKSYWYGSKFASIHMRCTWYWPRPTPAQMF